MKNILLFFGVAAFFLTSCGNGGMGGGGKAVALNTEMDSISYVIGQNMGKNFKRTIDDTNGGVTFNLDAVYNGIANATNGEMKIDETTARKLISSISQKVNDVKQKKDSAEAEKNLAEGNAFLAENKDKEGVITTPTGLQYKVIQEGTGPSPVATDKVLVHYHGTLINGDVFDSSVERGKPIDFSLQGVIPGWTEGIPTMKVGGKTTFYIPPNIAYGPKPRPSIPGNSVLIFEVELLDILTQ